MGAQGAASISAGISECVDLTYLDMSRNDLGDTGCTSLAPCLQHCGKLEELVLSNNTLGDPGLLALSRCFPASLARLNLANNCLTRRSAVICPPQKGFRVEGEGFRY